MCFCDKTIDKKLEILETIGADVCSCVDCNLYKKRKNPIVGHFPKEAFNKDVKIMFIDDYPGIIEDLDGAPMIDRGGKVLNNFALNFINRSRSEYFIANVIKCKPVLSDHYRLLNESFMCIEHLYKQIGIVNPDLIIAFGQIAAHSLLRMDNNRFYKEASYRESAVLKLRNKIHSTSTPSIYRYPEWRGPIIVTYHPNSIFKNKKLMRLLESDFKFINNYIKIIKKRKSGVRNG